MQSVEEKEKGCETYNMDQENEVSKIFSVSLGSNKGGRGGGREKLNSKNIFLASYSKI